MASSESVNYYIRPGKNVERKLVFECFRTLSKVFDVASYRYVGLGSIWFIDFILAHKILHIQDMVSIEEDDRTFSRAVFNKPFDCITVEHGTTTSVLPDLELEKTPHLVWLDYDTGLDGPAFDDLEILCSKLPSGSIITLTLNAHNSAFKDLVDSASDAPTVDELLEELRAFSGNALPEPLPKNPFGRYTFPKIVADIMFNQLAHVTRTRSGNQRKFIPLFHFFHEDGAPMTTIGGIIMNDDDIVRYVDSGIGALPQMSGRKQVAVMVPPLTFKEKAALDQLLPNDELTETDVRAKYGFELRPKQVLAYREFYRYYPMYGEIDF